MKQFMLDQSLNDYMKKWAASNLWEILDCSSPDSEFTRQYAQDQGGMCVADPRGRNGYVVVVRPFARPQGVEP